MFSNKPIKKNFFTLDDFLKKYDILPSLDIKKGILLDFEIGFGNRSHKILPILQLAQIKHADSISSIFKNAYNGTYPFKIFEDKEEIKNMINSKKYVFLIFKTLKNKIVGCVGAKLQFKLKKGYIFGYAIKKSYQGKLDSIKTWFTSLVYLWKNYYDKIFIWTSEVRTYRKTPQMGDSFVGLKPIAFLPNKDIFNNQIESEFFTIIYNKNVLKKYRSQKIPRIIRQVLNSYNYSNIRYGLGNPIVVSPTLNLNKEKIIKLKNGAIIRTKTDKYANKIIKILLNNSKSYFQFFYNSLNNNIEKIKYKIDNLEELTVFLRNLKLIIINFDIRYVECYVSAYKPKHQKLFYKAEFRPRGYVPCLIYDNDNDNFKDIIIFNYYKEEINPNLKLNLIPEARRLYRYLDKNYLQKSHYCIHKTKKN